jgi:glycosidase
MQHPHETDRLGPIETFRQREADWRNGAVVYQVLVDRFAPSKHLDQKRALYAPPRSLMPWNEVPLAGSFVPEAKYWSHELAFWGGDLESLTERLDYIQSLGTDVLYLNPICLSLSNHKYDATDYAKISPEYGTRKDLKHLIEELHRRGMKLMLDGVFNHVGVNNPLFLAAKDPSHPKRSWFDFKEEYPEGVRLWADVKSLPELNLEQDEVKDYLFRKPDSIIRSYLREGVDGWRLDVAFDIGFSILAELTAAAHAEKPGSMVVGEIWNYPEQWLKSIDGVMNFTLREIILRTIRQNIAPATAGRMIESMIEDAGIDAILKSWIVLDNHDVPRLNFQLPDPVDQALALALQFTLPGSPNLYYGTELGMEGGQDPANRAPMRWDLSNDDNPVLRRTLAWTRLHKAERALRIGDYIPAIGERLLAFERRTDRVEETILVLINPTDGVIREHVLFKDSKLMNYSAFEIVAGSVSNLHFLAGLLDATVPAKSYAVLKPVVKASKSYTPYKRV